MFLCGEAGGGAAPMTFTMAQLTRFQMANNIQGWKRRTRYHTEIHERTRIKNKFLHQIKVILCSSAVDITHRVGRILRTNLRCRP